MVHGTAYEVITTIPNHTTMTRIAKGRQTGELWDRVKLDNGLVGYCFQSYLEIVNDIPVKEIKLSLENTTLQKGERVQLKVQILPENATDKHLTYTSSNSNVVSIDTAGKLLAVSSGQATITAKAKNNIANSITIRVNSKVTGLQLKEEELILQVGETYTILPLVLPEDASNPKVHFKSSKEDIAIIDTNGKITANAEGNCKVQVTTQDGNFQKEVNLVVIPKIEEGAISFAEEITVRGNQITGIKEKMTVEELLTKITTKYELEIQNAEGKKLENKDLVGTQTKVIVKEQGKIVIEYIIILYGDVNGDGKINSVDLLVLQRHILEIKQLTGIALKAGNIDKSGKRPSSVDLLKIQRHILGLKQIEQ